MRKFGWKGKQALNPPGREPVTFILEEDYRTPECEHTAADACYHCCNPCNHDLHKCGGCGEPMQHEGRTELGTCNACRKLYFTDDDCDCYHYRDDPATIEEGSNPDCLVHFPRHYDRNGVELGRNCVTLDLCTRQNLCNGTCKLY